MATIKIETYGAVGVTGATSRCLMVSISCSPEAERQRRRRERRRRGAMVVQVVIGPAAIRELIRLGWLRDGERTDRQAVREAFVRFAKSALGHA